MTKFSRGEGLGFFGVILFYTHKYSDCVLGSEPITDDLRSGAQTHPVETQVLRLLLTPPLCGLFLNSE